MNCSELFHDKVQLYYFGLKVLSFRLNKNKDFLNRWATRTWWRKPCRKGKRFCL